MNRLVLRAASLAAGLSVALALGACGPATQVVDKGDVHFQSGNFCDAAAHYNDFLRKGAADPTTVAKRDEAARRCAMRVIELGRTSLKSNQVAKAIETFDAFYAQTDSAQGVP